jgi:putative transposase
VSAALSPSTGRRYGLRRVCQVWGVPRSTVYAAQARSSSQPTGAALVERVQESTAQPTGAPQEEEAFIPSKRIPERVGAGEKHVPTKDTENSVSPKDSVATEDKTEEKQSETTKTHKKRDDVSLSNAKLLELIKEDIKTSPFIGEGYKKIFQRLKRKEIKTSRKRILRLMRENNLLSPSRSPKGEKNKHDGRITTDNPNEMWGTDGMKIMTVEEGWIWVFTAVEHWNAECVGYHVAKIGSRYEALEPLRQGLEKYRGGTGKGAGKGISARHDWGTQYTSEHFTNHLKYWEMKQSYGYVREPETNGVAERFNRTLKEQVFNGMTYKNVEEVRKALGEFIGKYNEAWLVEKNGYRSPLEMRRLVEQSRAAA